MEVKDEKVDKMINDLLQVRGKKPGQLVSLTED